MFDPEAFGAAMGELIRAAVEPLEKRIDELQGQLKAAPDFEALVAAEVEKRMAAMPAPKNGTDGAPGKSVTLDDVRPMLLEAVGGVRTEALEAVQEAVKAIPAPQNGKDADMDAVKAMVAEAVAALPAPTVLKAEDLIPLLPKGEPGRSITLDDVRPVLDEAIQQLRKDADAVIAEPLELAEKARDMLLEKLGELKQPEDGKSVTPDDVAPMVRAEVEKAVAALPKPNDGVGLAGAMIDRAGDLLVTLTNGDVKTLGPVVGRDGVSLDSFELEYIEESHEIAVKATCGARTKELRYPAGGIRPGGYWREGTKAQPGEAWVHDGSTWIAKTATSSKPETRSEDWIIAARKGRDGERGNPGKDGSPPAPIKLGA